MSLCTYKKRLLERFKTEENHNDEMRWQGRKRRCQKSKFLNIGPSSKRLEDKVAVVTGGARGIGRATVRLFARHGATVIAADIDLAGIVLAESLGPAVTFIHCDVSIDEEIRSLINSAVAQWGQLDIFCSAGGVCRNQQRNENITSYDAFEFDRVMDVDVCGAVLGMKHATHAMMLNGNGSIISTTEVGGVMGGIRHAIVGLTQNIAGELHRHGIRANCVSSSNVQQQGIVRPQDIAEAVLFIASDESKHIFGHNIVVGWGATVM